MALVKCPECGRDNVSDRAGACPSCGCPIRPAASVQHMATTSDIRNQGSPIQEEKVLFDGMSSRLAWAAYKGTGSFIIHACCGFIFAWLLSYMNKIRITTTRITVVAGLISQKEERVELFRVRDTKFEQNIIQRLTGTGTVILVSNDKTAPQIQFPMEKPKEWVDRIRVCINEERKANRVLTMDQ